jgi:phospholipid/cholesterol/gamma-HCH transport system substrate-binding protein
MKRSIFGIYQYNEIVGAVVLGCVAVFVAVLINAGVIKGWFQPAFTLRVLLPVDGVEGLSSGAEVHVLGIRVGDVGRIVIDPNQRIYALARIDKDMRPFIRRNSVVSIRRQFGVAGAAYIDISRGTGPELDWSYAVVEATTERAATDTIGELIDDLRAKIIPLIDDTKKAVQAFTVVAQRAVDPAGPIEQTLVSTAGIVRRIEKGEGAAGRLVGNEKVAADLEATLVSLRELTGQMERTSKDPRIGEIVQRTNAILASLQTTSRGLAETTPKITQNVVSTADMLPATLLQAQVTAHELELLLAQLRHHWLFGGSGNTAASTGTRAPAVQVRP